MGAESARGIGLRAVILRSSLGFNGVCLIVLAVAGCASTPPEEDPVQIKLHDLDTRIERIERVLSNQSLLDLANQGESLRRDLRSMHNDVDQLTNGFDASRKQQRDLYADIDRRLKNLESHGVAAASGAGDDSAAAGADDKAAYQNAFSLLKDSQYDRAIAAFQKFLASFPDSPLSDNAQYWLGEAYYVNKSFPEAQSSFQRVVDKYPGSHKRADALLKIGYCQYELKDFESAKATLTLVSKQFPDAPAAHLAQQRLEKMAAEKH
jgi:tol-pal system protein YbgF